MNNIANTTTLWQLLGKCKMVIPILQRDYAQGRVGYASLREKFLLAISEALNGEKQLKLDFVYGSSDQDDNEVQLLESSEYEVTDFKKVLDDGNGYRRNSREEEADQCTREGP